MLKGLLVSLLEGALRFLGHLFATHLHLSRAQPERDVLFDLLLRRAPSYGLLGQSIDILEDARGRSLALPLQAQL